MNTWDLHTPDDFRAAYDVIAAEIRRHVIGHDFVVAQLALAGVRHVGRRCGERLLLVGPSGCGKSTLTRALAEALDVPWLSIDVTMLAEQNWHGADLSDFLEPFFEQHGDRADEAVLVLDEIDKICSARFDDAAMAYRIGKQQSLLPLLGMGAEIPLPGRRKVRSDRMLMVMAGVFDGLPPGIVGPGDLLRLGLMREIAERMGPVLRLEALSGRALIEVLGRGLQPAIEASRAFGVEMVVAEATLAYVASRICTGRDAGPRSGVAWMRSAVDRRLVELLQKGAPPGTKAILRPDDIALPRERGLSSGGEGTPPEPTASV